MTSNQQILLLALLGGFVTPHVMAQSSPASGPGVQSPMPLEDYLGLLRQIAPAAETGARAYIGALSSRCGRRLGSDDLRRAIADGPGDPALMAMIHAAQARDEPALQRIVRSIDCSPKAAR